MNKISLTAGIVYLLTAMCIGGCNSYGSRNDKQNVSYAFIGKQNFKLTALTSFSVDSFLNNKPIQLMLLDSATKKKFFSPYYHHDTVCEDAALYGDVYYYSWQPNNRNQVEFTLLVKQESGVSDLSCTQIRYVALDSTGKLLYNFIAAERTNYTGLHFVQYKGEFISDSMYKKSTYDKNENTGEVTYMLHNNHTITY
jgi:hypothetical protein